MTDKAGVTTTSAPTADASDDKVLSSMFNVQYDYQNRKDWIALNVKVLSIPWVLPLEIGAAISVAAAHLAGREAKVVKMTPSSATPAVLTQVVRERLSAALKISRQPLPLPLRPLNFETSYDTFLERKPVSGIRGVRVSSKASNGLLKANLSSRVNASATIPCQTTIMFAAWKAAPLLPALKDTSQSRLLLWLACTIRQESQREPCLSMRCDKLTKHLPCFKR